MEQEIMNNKAILITGGTGYLGQAIVKEILNNYMPKKVVIFSRDVDKQKVMIERHKQYANKLEFYSGDITNREQVLEAFCGIDYVIHTAACKEVKSCEDNVLETLNTNVYGMQNVIFAAMSKNVEKVVFISSDKAVNPVNLYGYTKFTVEKMLLDISLINQKNKPIFSIVRFGNLVGCPGTVIPVFKKLIASGADSLTISNPDVTRFWVNPTDATNLVIEAIAKSAGGEIFIPKCSSYRIIDLGKALLPNGRMELMGMGGNEKIYETLISQEEGSRICELEDCFVILLKAIEGENSKEKGFEYMSDDNALLMDIDEIKKELDRLENV